MTQGNENQTTGPDEGIGTVMEAEAQVEDGQGYSSRSYAEGNDPAAQGVDPERQGKSIPDTGHVVKHPGNDGV